MSLHTKHELSRSTLSKIRAIQTDRQTDRCDWTSYHKTLHSRVVQLSSHLGETAVLFVMRS